jgi:hypothetical protein
MPNNTSIYGSGVTSGNVSSSNYTTLYSGGGSNVPAGDNVIITGTLTVNGCSILTDCNAFNLLPFNATTVNAFGSATAVSIGGASGVTTIQNQLSTANYLFPLADGTANQVLTTDGNGILSFTDVGSLGVVTSITGTANQVIASSPTGAVTLSLPQDIATTSNPVFAGITGGNVTVGVVDNQTISTITGDLTIDSNSDLVKVDATEFNVNSNNLFVKNNRVGINNNAPDFELHIDQGQDSLTQFGMTNNERTFIISNNGADDLLSLYYGSLPPTGFNRLQFNLTDQWFNTGRLGVGTTTPAYELDVQGTGRFTSNLIAGTSLSLTGLTSGSSNFVQSAAGPVINYLLPTAQGAVSTVLTNDGSGNLSWALPGGGGSTFGNITVGVVTDNTISTTTGNLVLASATNEIDASTANITATAFTIDNRSTIETQTLTTTSVATVPLIDTGRNVMKCVVSVVDNVTGERHALELLALEKSTTAYITTYAEMYSGAALATFSADVSAGLLRLLVTPTSTNSTTFNVVRTSLT